MFNTLLIANRGEIACRIIRTAQEMGLRCVAVYSEADAGAQHVKLADEAHLIGPAPAAESYLAVERILGAAKAAGAEAVHPGYGFLSENADFAEACGQAGLIFVGPPPAAIRAMGSKSEAKALMEAAGVPVVPGYHGAAQDLKTLQAAAEEIGYPVLIKASAGGGGKGMRVVPAAGDLAEAVASAQREAAASFGDDRVLLEKYLTRPRHIEVQIFCDAQGGAVHLFERDCSLQRRHQKVLEEAPAPGITAAQRQAMTAAALDAAKAIGYVGAGTVEFIAEGGNFYFMEMNTRLQVEHPVTEMVTGQDLVAWQLRVAAGEALPLAQAALSLKGHAFEARLYAEDPGKNFLPATGRLDHLRLPHQDSHLRIDSGVVEGDQIVVHYDPMMAKLVVWGETRSDALRRLSTALAEIEIVGLTTNVGFLGALAAQADVVAGNVDTGLIERHLAGLLPDAGPAGDEALALAALSEMLHQGEQANAAAARSGDPFSPWNQITGWRLNSGTHSHVTFLDGDQEVTVVLHFRDGGYDMELPGGRMTVSGSLGIGGDLETDLGGRQQRARVVRRGKELTVLTRGNAQCLRLKDPLDLGSAEDAGAGRLIAPMPGKVVAVLVTAGEAVEAGAALMRLEAMKMEHSVAAPTAGVVSAVHFAAGDLVEEGDDLLDLESGED